jgi:hypothetical protein
LLQVNIGNYLHNSSLLEPGSVETIDHHYCFSQINVSFSTSDGTKFYQPRLHGSGTYNGTDFESNAANYGVSAYAYGTSAVVATAADSGLVAMTLPQGSYNFRPFITSINPNSTESQTELPNLALNVGCGQEIIVTPDLQVQVNAIPQCTGTDTLTVTGSVNAEEAVDRVYYTLNDGTEVDLCGGVAAAPCGDDPLFSFDVSLIEGSNNIKVTAVDVFGTVSSVSLFTSYTPDTDLTCPGDQTFEADASSCVIPVSQVTLPTGTGITCDAPAVFEVGTTTVTCTGPSDSCSNGESSCSFVVTVTAPLVSDEPLVCPANVTLYGEDPYTCSLSSGSVPLPTDPLASCDLPDTFPVGTTTVTCTAPGSCGGEQRTCSYNVTVPVPAIGDVHTQGFWKRQCKGGHPSGEIVSSYYQCVNDTLTFGFMTNGDQICTELYPSPENDKCEQARAQFTAVLLNVCADRLAGCNCINDSVLGATTVEEAIAYMDTVLAGSALNNSQCTTVQGIADRINTMTSLVSCPAP